MVDQASLDRPRAYGNGHNQSAAAGVRQGVGELVSDIVELGELQSQLLVIDAKESLQKAKTPLIMIGVGAVLALGSIPVLLLAGGEALVELFELSRALSYLIVSVIAAAVGGVLLYLATTKFNDVAGVFKRSTTELSENIRWIKYALTRGRRPPR